MGYKLYINSNSYQGPATAPPRLLYPVCFEGSIGGCNGLGAPGPAAVAADDDDACAGPASAPARVEVAG